MTTLKSLRSKDCSIYNRKSKLENPNSKIGISPLPPEPDLIDLHAAEGCPIVTTWC